MQLDEKARENEEQRLDLTAKMDEMREQLMLTQQQSQARDAQSGKGEIRLKAC